MTHTFSGWCKSLTHLTVQIFFLKRVLTIIHLMDIFSDSVKSQFYSPYSHYYYYYYYYHLAVLPLIIHMRNIRVDEISQTVFASRFSDWVFSDWHACYMLRASFLSWCNISTYMSSKWQFVRVLLVMLSIPWLLSFYTGKAPFSVLGTPSV
jgi:hypothetical protein